MESALLSKHLECMVNAGTPYPVPSSWRMSFIPANMELVCSVAQRYNMTIIEDCPAGRSGVLSTERAWYLGAALFLLLLHRRSYKLAQQAHLVGPKIAARLTHLITAGVPVEKLSIEAWLRPYPPAPLQAAVLLPQLAQLKEVIEKKRLMAKLYRKYLTQFRSPLSQLARRRTA